MTYAQIAEKLNKQYNKYDKNLQNAVTDAEKNSAMMMLQRVSSRLNQLMVSNQSDADMQDAKNTPADSPNQSIGQRTMRMAKNGGSLKSIPKGKKGKGLSKLSKKVRNKIGYMQGGGSTDPENNIVYTYAPGVTAESMYPGSVTLDDLRGTEVFTGLEPVNGMHANFLNFINTGHSGYLPKDTPGKHQAMRKYYLQNGKVQDNLALRSGDLPVPKFGNGGNVSWMFGGKKYSGTLIPSKETSTHRYARTHNGKIKSLPKSKKMQGGGKTLPKLSVDELNALSYEQRMPYYNLPPTDPRSFSFNTAGYLPSQTEFERMPNDVKAGLFTNNPQMDYRFGAADAPNFKSMTPEDQMRQNPYNRPFLPLETERMGFLGNLPNQNVDFQLSNFDKNSGVNNVLANRLFEADSLNQLPVQHSNFELSNFRPSPENFKQFGGVVDGANILQKDGKLYDGLTQEAVQAYMEEAGAITGLGNKFDPTNPEHVKKLQEGLLGAYKGPGYDRMLSGNESAYINKGGEFSKNNAGQDGRFGIDTFNALKQFTEEKPVPLNLSRQSVQPFAIPPTGAPLLNMEKLQQRDPVTQNTSETSEDNEGGGVKDFLKNTALKSLPGLAKGIEYMNTYNTLNKMLPPPDLTLNRPQYLNTNVDISADLNALNEAGVMRERALTDSSTKANNVRTNLAGQDSAFNKVRNKLFQDQRNKERQLQNAQTAMNFKTEDENRKRIYDNAMNQRDFINDQSRARRDFTSGVVGDVMDYTTQNTDRQSQMARMNALMPYLNQFGVFDRAYDEDFLGKYPFMKELLGLKT